MPPRKKVIRSSTEESSSSPIIIINKSKKKPISSKKKPSPSTSESPKPVKKITGKKSPKKKESSSSSESELIKPKKKISSKNPISSKKKPSPSISESESPKPKKPVSNKKKPSPSISESESPKLKKPVSNKKKPSPSISESESPKPSKKPVISKTPKPKKKVTTPKKTYSSDESYSLEEKSLKNKKKTVGRDSLDEKKKKKSIKNIIDNESPKIVKPVITPKIIPQGEGEWDANEPFVLHFLLDGLITDNLGNNVVNVSERLLELLDRGMIPDWEKGPIKKELIKLYEEIKTGHEYYSKLEISKKEKLSSSSEESVKKRIEDIATNNPGLIKKDMIISTGYQGNQGNHVVSYRLQASTKTITYINSGDGLEFHKQLNNKYKLYMRNKYSTVSDYEKYAYIALSSIKQNHINKAFILYNDVVLKINASSQNDDYKIVNNGTIGEVQSYWMTSPNKYEIVNGDLYCSPQITGTCSFHSLYWQLLLSIWNIGGSKMASLFEYRSRYFVLERGIKLSNLSNKRTAEQISCLQLIYRMHSKFKGKETLLDTLMYEDSNNYVYSTHAIKYKNLPLSYQNRNNIKLSIIGEDLKRCLTSDFREALKYLNKSMVNLGNDLDRYLYYIKPIIEIDRINLIIRFEQIIAVLEHIASLEIYNTILTDFRDITLSTKIYSILLKYFYYADISKVKYNSYRDNYKLIIKIAARIYNKLEEKYKLPIYDNDKTEESIINYIIPGYNDCITYNFVRDHGIYFYPIIKVKSEKRDVIVNELKKKSTNDKPYFINRIENNGQKDVMLEKFIRISIIHECMLIIFGGVDIYKFGNISNYMAPNPIYYLDLRLASYADSRNYNNSIGVMTDLDSGLPLTNIAIDYILPEEGNLSSSCIGESEFIINVNLIANPDAMFNYRKEWLKNLWLKKIPEIANILVNENLLKFCYMWLIYLWYDCPDSFKILLKDVDLLLIKKRDSFWLYIFKHWLTDGKDTNFKYIANNFESKYILKENIIILDLFAKQTIKNPNTSHLLLAKFDRLTRGPNNELLYLKSSVSDTTPEENIIWPHELSNLHWPLDVSKGSIKYIKEGKELIFPIENNSYIYQIYKDAQIKEIPAAMWVKDSSFILEIRIGEQDIILSKDKIMLPNEEIYSIVVPSEVPLLIRQWTKHYIGCTSICLKQESKYYFIIMGNKKITLKGSVFDRIASRGITLNVRPFWYIFQMQDCGIMPILNRDTAGWNILLLQLMNSVKVTCLEYMRPLIPYLMASNTIRNEYNRYFKELPTPILFMNNMSRKEYTIYFEEKYDITSEEPLLDRKLAAILSCQITGPPYIKYLDDISRLTRIINNNPDIIPQDIAIKIFEAISGFIVKPEQLELIKNMWNDLSNKEAKVHIALMGIGKSKVILPILTIKSILQNTEALIVQPNHLVPQTLNTLDELIPLIFSKNMFEVISDVNIKDRYLSEQIDNGYKGSNKLVLFDEIDLMYNTHKSEYNNPSTEIFHPVKGIDKDKYCRLVVDNCYDGESKMDKYFEGEERFYKKFKNNVIESRSMKYYYEYGQSDIETEMIAVPYMAVGTPVYKSNFSDIDLAALLTCHIRRKRGLLIRDFIYLQGKIKLWENIIGDFLIVGIKSRNLLSYTPEEAAKLYAKNKDLQRFYLVNLLLPEKLSCYENQFNVSFIDLMSPAFSTQRIGFSGTQLIHLPEFNNYTWFDIIPDNIGAKKIRETIIGWSSDIGIYKFSYDDMWKVIKERNINVIIDSDALLNDFDESIEVVARWAEEEKNDEYVYVFIDDKHYAREYKYKQNGDFPLYKMRKDVTFRWYFDQRHTIGTNMMVHPQAKALTLVTQTSKITPVAQAVYRLRGIGENGQTTEFMIETSKEIPKNREQLYNLFISNDEEYKQNMLKRHYIQNYKAVARIDGKHLRETYREKIKYYPDDIILNKHAHVSDLAISIEKKIYETKEKEEVNLESQVMQERAHEQERENLAPKAANCEKTFISTYETDYYLKELKSNYIIYSDYSLTESLDNMLPNNLSFIYDEKENGVMIITVGEELFIKTRNIKIKGTIYHRHDPEPENVSSNYYLATGICGKHLSLDKQLLIIKNAKKYFLMDVWQCHKALNYDILRDYFLSQKESKDYLASFKEENTYKIFKKKWIKWDVDNEEIEEFYEKCMNIISK